MRDRQGLRRLDEIEGPMGHVLRLHYGATETTEGLIHRIEEVTGSRDIYFTYDEHNNLETYTDPEGSVTTYVYDQGATTNTSFFRCLHRVEPSSATPTRTAG